MLALASALLAFVAGLLAIPVALFLLEVIAAVVATRKAQTPPINCNLQKRIAVLVPAHNESVGLLPTLQDIRTQLRIGDRLLVVADNCTDDTATVAAETGAEVVIRNDSGKIGKGFALEFGLRHLNTDPPDYLIIIDADCRLADNAIEYLSITSAQTGRPVQALYLMLPPETFSPNYQMAAFAWRVKNWVRPLGLSALGLPCQLMGTGMAFPWPVMCRATLASGQIVEDLNLGLDLALTGYPSIFCPSAQVTSHFPSSNAAADQQRQRWEQGHIDMIMTRAPSLIVSAITRRSLSLLALALDLAIPPIALLALLTASIVLLASLVAWLINSYAALIISVGSFAALVTALSLCLVVFARDMWSFFRWSSIVPYAAGKLLLYWRLISGRRLSQWIRTERE
jgi:cellulose synthase/poly-beta-1,6-N-acetylglucosamine synthase-like glycosyltransferase